VRACLGRDLAILRLDLATVRLAVGIVRLGSGEAHEPGVSRRL
jgi:hypothetical protein